MKIVNNVKICISENALSLFGLPLYGIVTRNYLHDLVKNALRQSDINKGVKDWFDENDLIVKCANVVAHDTLWGGDVPCPRYKREGTDRLLACAPPQRTEVQVAHVPEDSQDAT